MNDIPTCPAHLDRMTCIASVSSRTDTKDVWTDLAIWYRAGSAKPFITVIEGKVQPGQGREAGMVPRFRAIPCGTLSRAVGVLDQTGLRDELVNALPQDADTLYPDSDTVRMREADERRGSRGYTGAVSLGDALEWLYPNPKSVNAVAEKFEKDFGIGPRTTRGILTGERDGKEAPTWVTAFIEALRYFDRKAWEHRDV